VGSFPRRRDIGINSRHYDTDIMRPTKYYFPLNTLVKRIFSTLAQRHRGGLCYKWYRYLEERAL
jgi:hypothetical protein